VLRSNLPLPTDFDWLGARDTATIFIGDIQHKLELRSQLVAYGLVETMVTQGLKPDSMANLSAWLERPGVTKVSFTALETGTYMSPVVAGSELQAFASRCGMRPSGHSG